MSENKMKKTQYLYFRKRDEEGRISPFGGATVAYIPLEELPRRHQYISIGRSINENVLIGVSVCSAQDLFNKKKGRGYAMRSALRCIYYDYMTMGEFSDLAQKMVDKEVRNIYDNKIQLYESMKEDVLIALQKKLGLDKDYKKMFDLIVMDKRKIEK